ncbi:MAG: hypothetical protein JW700_00450 [Candidatus Aenigmarchaeota archaeon]|nr:hypothetical protein [Candidatus Aenigmarchaeota archaeon]
MEELTTEKRNEFNRYMMNRFIEIDLEIEALCTINPKNPGLGHDKKGTYRLCEKTGKKFYLWDEKSCSWESEILSEEEAMAYMKFKSKSKNLP